jgi:hypothetical protein
MGYAKTTNKKRSPVKEKALRNPGESLDREIGRVYYEDIYSYVIAAMIALLFAGYEWARWFWPGPPQPIPVSIIVLAAVCYYVYKVVRLRQQAASLEQGLEGEKAVGQDLETLRTQGCRVMHDIVGPGFNVDHVIIAPQGVFVVETKTVRKPAGNNVVVQFDGEVVRVNGFQPDRNPVVQALAERRWVQDLLLETTGRRFPSRAVVLYPGWYVEPATGRKRDDIWVLNPKALPTFISHEAQVLPPEDVALVFSRLATYVRDHA